MDHDVQIVTNICVDICIYNIYHIYVRIHASQLVTPLMMDLGNV